jgi:hypothetical protein
LHTRKITGGTFGTGFKVDRFLILITNVAIIKEIQFRVMTRKMKTPTKEMQ